MPLFGACMQITRELLYQPQLDCSSPSEIRKQIATAQARLKTHRVATELYRTVQTIIGPEPNNIGFCQWIECNLMSTSNSTVAYAVLGMAGCSSTDV